jgi:uncharacterized OB-fold protein
VTRLKQIPIVDYLMLDSSPHLQGKQCVKCDAIYFDRRNACARCSGTEFSAQPLPERGYIRAFTVIHRAGPTIRTPFISVVVELDNGSFVKANLLDTTDPNDIQAGARVALATFVAATDDDGTEAVAFGFRLEDTHVC